MNNIKRIMTNICSDNLPESADFYINLLDLKIEFNSDWFVHLVSKDKRFELGIINRTNSLVPEGFQVNPQGFYLTFVVENTDAIYEIALKRKFEIVSSPSDTFYGQRRLLLKDPSGALIDISSPIPDFQF